MAKEKIYNLDTGQEEWIEFPSKGVKPRKKTGKESVDTSDETDLEKEIETSIVKTKKDSKVEKLTNTNNALNHHAKMKLESYMKKSPQYRVLDTQIALLLENLQTYKKLGDTEKIEESERLIKELSLKKNRFVKIFKNKNRAAERETTNIKIKESQILKDLKDKKDAKQKELDNIMPATLLRKLKFFRDNLPEYADVDNLYSDIVIDLDSDIIEDEFDSKQMNNKTEYLNLCNRIADLCDITPDEVISMRIYEIQKLLNASIDKEDVERIKDDIKRLHIETSNEIKKIKGGNDITDVMFEIFDFKIEEEAPKEMLASANVGYVTAIAYNICSKQNCLNFLDDAVSDGLLALVNVINMWYETQKISDNALSFEGLAYLRISNAIKRGLYTLSSGGRISGSMVATLKTKHNKEVKFFIENNPEFKDLPKDMLDELVSANVNDEGIGYVNTASSIEDNFDSEDGDVDMWERINLNDTDQTIAEAEIAKKELINSMKAMFNLFEQKEKDGNKYYTSNKVFDYEDYLIFLMRFGLKFKDDGTKYNQEEIAEYITDYRLSRGNRKTMSQPAVAKRWAQMLTKIKLLIDEHSKIKEAFEYLYYNNSEFTDSWIQNEIDDDNTYSLNDEITKEDIENGNVLRNKTFSDIFDDTTDLLDNEIAQQFNGY